jgi:hypothetical protein
MAAHRQPYNPNIQQPLILEGIGLRKKQPHPVKSALSPDSK